LINVLAPLTAIVVLVSRILNAIGVKILEPVCPMLTLLVCLLLLVLRFAALRELTAIPAMRCEAADGVERRKHALMSALKCAPMAECWLIAALIVLITRIVENVPKKPTVLGANIIPPSRSASAISTLRGAPLPLLTAIPSVWDLIAVKAAPKFLAAVGAKSKKPV